MRLSRRVHLIASGSLGCDLTHELDCNAFAVLCGDRYLLVDAGVGVESERISLVLREDGIDKTRIEGLLLTHAHLDHAGGARELTGSGCVPVCASREAARALETGDEEAIGLGAAKRSGIYPETFTLAACPVSRVLDGVEQWRVGDATIRVLRTPGHSDDMLTYLVETLDEGVLCFPGDTVFHGGRVMMADTPDCRPHSLAQSLQVLAHEGVNSLFPGHGLWSLRKGSDQIRAAMRYLDRGQMPRNFFD